MRALTTREPPVRVPSKRLATVRDAPRDARGYDAYATTHEASEFLASSVEATAHGLLLQQGEYRARERETLDLDL